MHPDNLGRQFNEFKFIVHPDFDFPDYDEDGGIEDGEVVFKQEKSEK